MGGEDRGEECREEETGEFIAWEEKAEEDKGHEEMVEEKKPNEEKEKEKKPEEEKMTEKRKTEKDEKTEKEENKTENEEKMKEIEENHSKSQMPYDDMKVADVRTTHDEMLMAIAMSSIVKDIHRRDDRKEKRKAKDFITLPNTTPSKRDRDRGRGRGQGRDREILGEGNKINILCHIVPFQVTDDESSSGKKAWD